MLPCHSGRHHKQEKKSRGNTSSCVGGQVKTRSLSLICQQNKQRTDKLKFCYKCFDWTLSGDRKEEWEEMLSGRERYIFPQSNTFSFFFFPVRDIRSLVGVCAATCVQPRWLAGLRRGVSRFVGSELRDYSLTRRLFDWRSPERSASHTKTVGVKAIL